MDLSRSILKNFAKITNDRSTKSTTTYLCGEAVIGEDGKKYVKIDGSEQITPVSAVTDIQNGDRVMVSIENHTATVIGNYSYPPSLRTANNALEVANQSVASYERLNAIAITTENLTANVAQLGYLTADEASIAYAKITELDALKADIDDIEAKSITTETLKAEIAAIGYLTAEDADLKYATITQLNTESARIDTVTGDLADYKKVMADELTVAKGWMAESSIGDAQISKVSANKLYSGTIDTALVTILGSDGRLQIIDNTIQISDTNRVRVQIGKDASNDYSMYVWDATGNLIFDALGATEHTIQRQIIRDNMVSDDAAIKALKVDFQSFETALTDQGVAISGTVVQVGDKTLNVTLSEQTQTLTDYGETLDDHAAKIEANETAIGLRVTTQEYESYTSTTDSRLTTTESAIEVLQGQILLKVEQTDIDTAIDGIDIGGRNLIRNSNTLLFEDYYFENTTIEATYDQNGNVTIYGISATHDGNGVVTCEGVNSSYDENGNVTLSV